MVTLILDKTWSCSLPLSSFHILSPYYIFTPFTFLLGLLGLPEMNQCLREESCVHTEYSNMDDDMGYRCSFVSLYCICSISQNPISIGISLVHTNMAIRDSKVISSGRMILSDAWS